MVRDACILAASALLISCAACQAQPAKDTAPATAAAGGEMAPAYLGLRAMALSPELDAVRVAESGAPVQVALMELGTDEGVATIAAFEDGSTSIYYSSGGGIIGAGSHEPVRRAAAAFRQRAEASAGAFTPVGPTGPFPLPKPDRVRFYLRTAAGTRTAEVELEALVSDTHPLHRLFVAGMEVITAVRTHTPQP